VLKLKKAEENKKKKKQNTGDEYLRSAQGGKKGQWGKID